MVTDTLIGYTPILFVKVSVKKFKDAAHRNRDVDVTCKRNQELHKKLASSLKLWYTFAFNYSPQRSCSKVMFYTCLWFCSQGELCAEGLCPRVVSVQGGLCPGKGLCPGEGLCPGGLCLWGLCLGEFLSRGFLPKGASVQGRVSVQGEGLCPEGVSVQGGSLSRGRVSVQGEGLCPGGGSLSRGRVSVQGEGLCSLSLCLGGSLFGMVSVQGVSAQGISVQEVSV